MSYIKIMKSKITKITFTTLTLLLTACGSTSGSGTLINNPGGTGGGNQTPNGLTGKVVTQPSLNAVKNMAMDSQIAFSFTDFHGSSSSSPSGYSIKAYSDQNCSTLAMGALTYKVVATGSELTIGSVIYSLPGDIYVGISGSSISTKACTQLVNVVSSAPVVFSVEAGQGQNGTVGATLPTPLKFKVFDTHGVVVQNAKIVIRNQTSAPSDSTGYSILSLVLGTVAGDITEKALLNFQGTLVHSEDINVSVYSAAAVKMAILNQTIPETFKAGNPSDPISLKAADKYGNLVYPTLWGVVFTPGTYADAACTVRNGTVSADQVNPSPILSTSDSSTWWNDYFYTVNIPGSYDVKLTLTDSSSNPVTPESSVCSAKAVVTP